MGNVQIRNVPPDLHRALKRRALDEGLSLSDYLLRIVEREARRPSRREMLDRLAALPRRELGEATVEAVRAQR
jgi:plasmid stability protein